MASPSAETDWVMIEADESSDSDSVRQRIVQLDLSEPAGLSDDNTAEPDYVIIAVEPQHEAETPIVTAMTVSQAAGLLDQVTPAPAGKPRRFSVRDMGARLLTG